MTRNLTSSIPVVLVTNAPTTPCKLLFSRLLQRGPLVDLTAVSKQVRRACAIASASFLSLGLAVNFLT